MLAILNVKARPRTSGVEVERRIGLVYRFREDGLIARMVSHQSVDEAREALGLG